MKTMTCRQMGGPCDQAFSGETADDVITQQDQHLKDMEAAGDEAHMPARKDMKARWRRPVSGLKWYNATKKAFAELPDDQT